MSFSKRITRIPRPYDADLGAQVQIDGASGAVAELVQASAACSPYLASLIAREGDWLASALDTPEAAAVLTWDLDVMASDLPDQLRAAKRRVALITALADLGGVWPLEMVTGTLTDFADAACDLALKAALAPLISRGKLPGVTLDALDDAAGLSVFAMGKMGAHELNYSSDIDLICLFDETRFDPGDYAELRSGFVRAVRKMSGTLSDIGPEGYVFRTDLRLRPDAGVTPVALSMGAAERYYESLGRTWERAAWIKARPAAGDIAAGERFQEALTPFVWRKHLDFAAIQDAHDMRLAIRDAKGLSGPISLPGHDMKLGRGGIREIEFYTQTRQLISGGRDTALRLRATKQSLRQLAQTDWVDTATADELCDHYTFHRTVEHRLQMVQDAQTHDLPRGADGFERLAAMMDMDVAKLEATLHERLSAVHGITEGFFAPGTQVASDTLDPDMLARWRSYPAFRSERAQASFDRVRPTLAAGLEAAARPQDALAAFDGFLSGLPAGVQLFALFEANPHLVDLLLDVLTIAPPLAEYLGRNAQVLDAVIGGDFFTPWPGPDGMAAALDAQLAPLDDYEAKLDITRRWRKEWHFRIGVHYLRGLTSAPEAAVQYADLARAVVAGLWPHVVAQFARRHGPPPGRGALILGMGSLGAGRLSPTSDLDMIVIYDPQDQTESTGAKPLPARTYFARLTQAMVTALSVQTAEGRLYEVDMRLRPSGNQGPVATSWRAFQDYQQNDAWTWEHLALTRARVIAGPPDLTAETEAFVAAILQQPRDRATVLKDVADMRQRIAETAASASPWQVKTGPGRLQDIELFVQAGALLRGGPAFDIAAEIARLPEVDLCTEDQAQILAQAYVFAANVQLALRLVAERSPDVEKLGAGAIGIMLRAADAPSLQTAGAQLEQAFAASSALVDAGLSYDGN